MHSQANKDLESSISLLCKIDAYTYIPHTYQFSYVCIRLYVQVLLSVKFFVFAEIKSKLLPQKFPKLIFTLFIKAVRPMHKGKCFYFSAFIRERIKYKFFSTCWCIASVRVLARGVSDVASS